jgi:hypothetical protein
MWRDFGYLNSPKAQAMQECIVKIKRSFIADQPYQPRAIADARWKRTAKLRHATKTTAQAPVVRTTTHRASLQQKALSLQCAAGNIVDVRASVRAERRMAVAPRRCVREDGISRRALIGEFPVGDFGEDDLTSEYSLGRQ